jgi:hypothetical protein
LHRWVNTTTLLHNIIHLQNAGLTWWILISLQITALILFIQILKCCVFAHVQVRIGEHSISGRWNPRSIRNIKAANAWPIITLIIGPKLLLEWLIQRTQLRIFVLQIIEGILDHIIACFSHTNCVVQRIRLRINIFGQLLCIIKYAIIWNVLIG